LKGEWNSYWLIWSLILREYMNSIELRAKNISYTLLRIMFHLAVISMIHTQISNLLCNIVLASQTCDRWIILLLVTVFFIFSACEKTRSWDFHLYHHLNSILTVFNWFITTRSTILELFRRTHNIKAILGWIKNTNNVKITLDCIKIQTKWM